MVTLASLEHPEKADFPMEVTLLGMVTLASLEQSAKA
jgi:hypothetical protein